MYRRWAHANGRIRPEDVRKELLEWQGRRYVKFGP